MHSEHIEQVTSVNWFRQNYPNYLIFAIPNGDYKAMSVAKRLKAEGVLSGVPDLCILAKDKTIWVEMKRAKGGTTSKEQKEIHQKMQDLGHIVLICKGFEEFNKKISTLISF